MPSNSFTRASSQYIDANSPVNATSVVTIGAWARLTGTQTTNARWEIMSNDTGFALHFIDVGGVLRLRGTVSDGTFPFVGTSKSISHNVWWLILLIRDASNGLKMFNAALGAGSVTQDGTTSTVGTPTTSSTNLRIGGHPTNATRYMDGRIFRPFVVWNHEATSGEMTSLLTQLPEDVFATRQLELYRADATTITDLAGNYTFTNNGSSSDADVPITEGGGGPVLSVARRSLVLGVS